MIACLAFAALVPITLAFGGDVMLGRGIEKAGVPPFGPAAEVLRSADLAFVNLECPLTERPFERRKVVNLRARPERVQWLVEAGIDGVSVANNHTGDCGREGLRDTVSALEGAGLFVAGLDALQSFPIRVVRGVRFGFLALTDFRSDAAPGVLVVDPETLESQVRGYASQVDHLVVSLHWGVEGARKPTPRQRELAARVRRGGASLVVGHGTHTLLPLEGGLAYSLGDLVFDRRGDRALLVAEVVGRRVTARLRKFSQ